MRIPRAHAVAGVVTPAAALQQAHVAPVDSVLVESPLPGGAAQVVRFLLNAVPPWLQLLGIVAAAVVLAVILRQLYRHRRTVRDWLASRSRGVRASLAALAIAVVAGVAIAGTATWDYTQHSNDFCTGCHVMNPAFQRFSAGENQHDELSCHACHQQSVFASARQLYLWVAERPQEIGPHSKVPNRVCEGCHVTADTATWQRIAGTAGHRVHFESDSAALEGLQCVTCHGVEVHRFRPVAETCGQSDCHQPRETDIVLGRMAAQTVRHCTSCHAFTADVPALASTDSARGALVPGSTECLGCHEMRTVLADFEAQLDPHGGKCGTCHDPHTQETPAAATSCAAAGCHDAWRDNPFHTGPAHRRVGERCLTCHQAHKSRVDASDCAGCHRTVRAAGRLRPPVPFDTAAALRRSGITPPPRPPDAVISRAHRPRSSGPSAEEPPGAEVESASVFGSAALLPARTDAFIGASRPHAASGAGATWPLPAAQDTFPHARHTSVACLECHQTGDGHGRLTFERPRGCFLCHHQEPATARCERCHRTEQYGVAKPMTVTVTVPTRAPNARPVDFVHERHVSRQCVECHSTPVTLAPAPAAAQCRDCHTEHHDAGRTCASCHRIAEPAAEHTPVEAAHQRCDACHTAATVARLTPTRSFCSTCHAVKATDHYDRTECTVCHFLADPVAYRPRLLTPPAR